MSENTEDIVRDQSKRLEELAPGNLWTSSGSGRTGKSELSIYNGGVNPLLPHRSAALQQTADESGGDEDEAGAGKVSRTAVLDVPLQFKTKEGRVNFALPARMVVNSSMVLSPRWTGNLSSFAEVLSSSPENSSGYAGGKVELDYELPPPSPVLSKVTLLNYKHANLNFGLVSRGYHRLIVGGKLVRPGAFRSQDLTISAQHTQWLNRPNLENSGQTTLTVSQKMGACTLQSIGTFDINENNKLVAAPTLTISLHAVKSISPWNLQVGWRWYPLEGKETPGVDRNLFWTISVTPKLSNLLRFHFNAGWTRTNGLTTTCLWKQNLQQDSSPTSHKLLSSKSDDSKTLDLGVQTNWFSKRMALLLVWTDNDFRLRIPIGLSHPATEVGDVWSFPIQSFFLTVLTRIVQDGLADILNLQKAQTQAQETAQQQNHLRHHKAHKDALKQQHLMKRQAEFRAQEEGETGLVIVEGIYGSNLSSTSSDTASSTRRRSRGPDSKLLDVTVALQFWVQQGQLELPASSKMNLLGFCDPRLLDDATTKDDDDAMRRHSSNQSHETKKLPWWNAFVVPNNHEIEKNSKHGSPLELHVQYRCGGFMYEITLGDEEGIVLPSPRATRIEAPKDPLVSRG